MMKGQSKGIGYKEALENKKALNVITENNFSFKNIGIEREGGVL